MSCLGRISVALILLAGPVFAQDGPRWAYARPNGEPATLSHAINRAAITAGDARVAVSWMPERATWRMFLQHAGWDGAPEREIEVEFSDGRVEAAPVAITALDRREDMTLLSFDLPDAFWDHLRAGSELRISSAAGPITLPLTGSSSALDDLADTRDWADTVFGEGSVIVQELAFECDRLTAWEGDADRIAAPVPWEAIDTDAALRACFGASDLPPNAARYTFQLGRAALRAGLGGGLAWVEQAADAGYPAASAYLEAPEG